MPTADEVERLGRERREADRRYNDSLTSLDRALVAVRAQPTLGGEELDRLADALIVFLQQITAFVDTKDRELVAHAGSRIESVERALEAISELRAQVGVLQRGMQTLMRSRPSQVVNRQSEAVIGRPPGHQPETASGGYKYVGFEDQFRGAGTAIEDRLRAYVPIFAKTSDVLDLGCGRGELLSALRAAGVVARGVDANGNMVEIARERGLEVAQGDALSHVESLPDASLGGAVATQVVEHLQPSYLLQLIDALSSKLRPRAPIVIETINPACWLAFFSSYIRDFTHERPVHPETLQYLLRASGFERVEIRYSAPVPDHMKMKTIDLPPEILESSDPSAIALARVAHAINANAVILNNLMFTHLDYAAIGYRA